MSGFKPVVVPLIYCLSHHSFSMYVRFTLDAVSIYMGGQKRNPKISKFMVKKTHARYTHVHT